MIEQILGKKNIKRALEHLQQKHDSCGVDGMRLSELPDYVQNNMPALRASVEDESFCPSLVQEIDIINQTGKIRTISKLASIDRLLLRAIHQVLYAKFAPMFSPFSYAYQENKGIATAARQAADYIEAGYIYVVDIDIESYFENIHHYQMGELLRKYKVDKKTNSLIQKYLACSVVRDFEIYPKEKGLVQGSPLSPLLSNIYLHEADLFFTERGYKFCRFGDDIKLFAKTLEDGLDIFGTVKQFIEKELHLNLHPQKSGVFPALDRVYLGYKFSKFSNGKIEIY
jgi:group II intron reverse transcriptase/maturase